MNTGIPDPLAYLELAIINEALPPSMGQCLGFALTAARLSLADFIPEDFLIQPGTDGSTVWDLNGPTGPSPVLCDFIHQALLEQTSVEFLTYYAAQIVADELAGLPHLINTVKSELSQGRPVLIPFQEGGFGGHCVLAYNVEDLPDGGEKLDIYDPNNPYLTTGGRRRGTATCSRTALSTRPGSTPARSSSTPVATGPTPAPPTAKGQAGAWRASPHAAVCL